MKLKDYLYEKRISVDEAATDPMINVSRTHLYDIISGKTVPGPKLALKIEAWSNREVTRAELRPDLWQDAA